MERTFINKAKSKLSAKEISKEIAIHEAGRATAIYFGNRKKGLPPVYFQIFIKPSHSDLKSSATMDTNTDRHVAEVEGGRLIHTLPLSFSEATKGFSEAQTLAYQSAYEADIVNLLIGPLAEAIYVALRDNEIINPDLVNIDALHYYGGTSDLNIVNEYLNSFTKSVEIREQKMNELFLEAFKFVTEESNWRTINALADVILAADQRVIGCNELNAVHGKLKLNDNQQRSFA